MPTFTLGRRRVANRTLSGLAVAAVAVTGVGLAQAAPAAADTPAPTLAWKISQQFDGHLSTHTLADGATEDESGVVTFPDGTGSYNPGNGTATESYGGSVTGAFVAGGTQYYSVTLADPTVTVAADGSGQISAVVSAANIAAGPTTPAASTDPTRVVVARFQGGSWTPGSALGTLSATPDWSGVLAAGGDGATALGIPSGQPLDGKAFAPEFLGQLTPGVRALFYASGSGSDPNKAPAPFAAQAAPMSVGTDVTSASYADGLDLAVTGSGFRAVTQPGDAGVYVGLAPTGGLPDVSSPSGMGAFAAVAYLDPASLATGAFSTTLSAPTDALVPSTTYAVYTWQAHAHSNVTQDTVTPVAIDWTALAAPTPAISYTTGKTSYAAGVRLTVHGTDFSAVTQPGDAGVYVGVAPRGGLPDVSTQEGQDAFAATAWVMPSQIVDGSFTTALTVPTDKLDRSVKYAIYTWQAHTHSTTSQDTVTPVAVDWASLKAPSTVKATVTKKPRPHRAGTLAVAATGAPGSGKPTGKVQVSVVRHGKVVKKLSGKQLKAGKATFRVPALAAGAVTLKVAYLGSADHQPAHTSRKLTIRR